MKNTICLLSIFSFSILFGQSNWTQINSNTTKNLKDIIFTSYEIGYVVGDDGVVLKTTDSGNSWSLIFSDVSQSFISISFINNNIGYILTSTNLYKTENSGNTWVLKYSSFDLNTVHFINENIGFIGTNQGILKTIDGGSNWSTFITNNEIKSISFPSENVGYFVGGTAVSDNIYKTTNQGMSYTETPLIMQSVKEKVFFVDDNIGFVIGWYASLIKKTIDGGQSWTNLYGFGDVDINFINSLNGYRIDNNSTSTILSTNDGGISWNMEQDSNDNDINNLNKISVKFEKAFLVGNNGKIYKKDILLSTNQIKKNEIEIFPNPTFDEISIKYDTNTVQINSVSMSDINGKIIENIKLNSSIISLQKLVKGTYLLTLNTDKGKITKKIICK